MAIIKDELLTAYWISFPDNPRFPLGFGVSAFTVDDALRLLEERGYDYHLRDSRVNVAEIRDVAEIEYDHVRCNMGPVVFRGIWYPCLNVGIDASGQMKR